MLFIVLFIGNDGDSPSTIEPGAMNEGNDKSDTSNSASSDGPASSGVETSEVVPVTDTQSKLADTGGEAADGNEAQSG